MYYVYLIRSNQDSEMYIGSTNDLKRRFEEHNNGKSLATKSRGQFELVYYEAYKSEADARRRESMLKLRGQAKHHLFGRLSGSLAI